jgi:hypothetical protein
MNARHRKTLASIFSRPTPASIPFADIEALIVALGGSITERAGSRVKIVLRTATGIATVLIPARRHVATR